MNLIKKCNNILQNGLRLNQLGNSQKAFINDLMHEYESTKYIAKYVKNINEDELFKTTNENKDIIWQLWFQGIDDAPQIVKSCFQSVDYHCNDSEIIRLTEKNIENYVNIPGFIYDKKRKGLISNVNFSDVLRVYLLAQHGGTWMDSTVYLTDKIDKIKNNNLFLFSTTPIDLRGVGNIKASSWYIQASKNSQIFNKMKFAMTNFWMNEDTSYHHYYFHLFFALLINEYKDCQEEWEKVPFVSNVPPHVLQMELFNEYNEERFKEIINMSPVHKLTFYGGNEFNTEKKNTIYHHIISNLC